MTRGWISLSEHPVLSLFKVSELPRYDLSRAPALVRLRDERLPDVDGELWDRWRDGQREFLTWTRENAAENRGYVLESIARLEELFKHRGLLKGNVLDVGGGWGLFRRWWSAGGDSQFIVHDPALERFLTGPVPLYRELYGDALGRPMTFVAGFGEELPYRDGVFDEFVCAAALDHALDPRRVLAEGLRCLKPDGRALVIVQCTGEAGEERTLKRSFGRRLLRAFRHPLRTLKRLFGGAKDHHLHHFTMEDLTDLLTSVGFTRVESRPYGVGSGTLTFYACGSS